MPFLGKTPTQLVDESVDINGGAIDGATIGATSASPATVTTFTSTGIDDNSTGTAITILADGTVDVSGNLIAGNGTNTSMSALSAGHIKIDGEGYDGAIALDATGMHIYHNSASRALIFGTNETERMRILAAGGLTFNGDTAAANALDDYEEGTWTPVLATSNADGTYSVTVQKAVYRKIGNIVFYSTYISAVSCTVQGTGNMRITGLPYNASTESNSYSGGVTIYGSMTAHTRGQITAPGYSYLRLIAREAVTAGEFDMSAADLGTNANFGSWIFQGFYPTD